MRIIAALLGLAVVILLGGCSALRLGYNQAPDLAFWWLDGYADFDDDQSLRVRNGLANWFTWHRRTQLPDYAALLVRAQAELAADTSAARTCAWWSDIGERLDAAVERAVPEIAGVVATLKPEQLRHLERQYAKKNAEFRSEYLEGDAAERAAKNLKRSVERAETIYGRLDDAQRERLARSLAQSPFDAVAWFGERQRRQQDLLATVRRLKGEGASPDQVQAAVRAFAQRMKRSPNETYRRYQEQLQQFNCTLSAELHNATTPAQRQTAVDKLRGWERDLRVLVAQASPA